MTCRVLNDGWTFVSQNIFQHYSWNQSLEFPWTKAKHCRSFGTQSHGSVEVVFWSKRWQRVRTCSNKQLFNVIHICAFISNFSLLAWSLRIFSILSHASSTVLNMPEVAVVALSSLRIGWTTASLETSHLQCLRLVASGHAAEPHGQSYASQILFRLYWGAGVAWSWLSWLMMLMLFWSCWLRICKRISKIWMWLYRTCGRAGCLHLLTGIRRREKSSCCTSM